MYCFLLYYFAARCISFKFAPQHRLYPACRHFRRVAGPSGWWLPPDPPKSKSHYLPLRTLFKLKLRRTPVTHNTLGYLLSFALLHVPNYACYPLQYQLKTHSNHSNPTKSHPKNAQLNVEFYAKSVFCASTGWGNQIFGIDLLEFGPLTWTSRLQSQLLQLLLRTRENMQIYR